MIAVVTVTKNVENPDEPSWVPIDQLVGPVSVGAEAMVIEGYTGDVADGHIAEIDDAGRRVRVDVDWNTLRTILDEPVDEGQGGGSDFESSADRFGGKAMSPGGIRWGFTRPAPMKKTPAPPAG
ncbi:MAG TPA: hypothetical protein VHT30_09130 [Acidimicrobiales bacterium]|jgi:hypothetical protein|nr:hypothetical protein [Acidimicrobiales bacterium]